jgi:hypothetical protein
VRPDVRAQVVLAAHVNFLARETVHGLADAFFLCRWREGKGNALPGDEDRARDRDPAGLCIVKFHLHPVRVHRDDRMGRRQGKASEFNICRVGAEVPAYGWNGKGPGFFLSILSGALFQGVLYGLDINAVGFERHAEGDPLVGGCCRALQGIMIPAPGDIGCVHGQDIFISVEDEPVDRCRDRHAPGNEDIASFQFPLDTGPERLVRVDHRMDIAVQGAPAEGPLFEYSAQGGLGHDT